MIYKVGAVILNDSGELLVARKNVPGRHTFIIPGGRRETGETDEETCIREVREELGVEVKKIIFLNKYEEKAEFEDEILIMPVYIVEIEGIPHASNEIVELEWISKDYKSNGIEIGSTLEKYIVPELLSRGLML